MQSSHSEIKKININDNSFDYIRITIAVIILLGHFIGHFQIENQILYKLAYIVRGVPLFFCLSGFLVARSVERYNLREFLEKRFFRIFPALWVCVGINLIIIVCIAGYIPSLKDFFIYLITQFSFLQFYTGSWLSEYGVGVPNGALWTITTDIQFYFVVYYLDKLLRNTSKKVWIGVILFLAVLSLILEKYNNLYPEVVYKLLSVSLLPFLYIFIFGMMIYYKRDIIIPWVVRNSKAIIVLYLLWNFLPETWTAIFNGIRYNIITTFLLMLSLFAIAYSFGSKRLKNDYSHSFYLYHMVVLNFIYHFFIKKLSNDVVSIVIFAIAFLTTSLLAYLSVHIVEKRLTNSLEEYYFNKKGD